MKNTFKMTIAVAVTSVLSLVSSSARADVTLTATLTDPYALGTDDPGTPNGIGPGCAKTEAIIMNELIGLAVNGTATIGSGTYTRSGNVFSPLPTADASTDSTTLSHDSSPPLSITLDEGYNYLGIKYANNEFVWDIAGIPAGTTIHIPSIFGDHGISDDTFLDPITPTAPDGGATLSLLGLAFAGLSLVRRSVK